jgi:hypothetical protein
VAGQKPKFTIWVVTQEDTLVAAETNNPLHASQAVAEALKLNPISVTVRDNTQHRHSIGAA